MNPITLSLPSSLQQVSHPRPTWFGVVPHATFWFPDIESKSVCMKALGLTDRQQQILLQCGDYTLLTHIFVGQTRREEMATNVPCLFYLSPRMFSGDPYFARPQRFAEMSCYSLCLLDEMQLARNEGEVSILTDLYEDAMRVFHTAPFLARNNARDFPALKQWFAEIVALINMQELKAHSDRRLKTACTYGLELLKLKPIGRIEQSEQLLALLALRQHGQTLAHYIGDVAQVNTETEQIFNLMPHALSEVAKKQADETSRFVYNIPFKPTLGSEVLPALRRVTRVLRTFAETLDKSPHESLRIIGQEMLAYLEDTKPILALTGTFSSGKTTLLNSLLIGQDNSHNSTFRTRQGANTAIVSEIIHVEADKAKQRVEFGYRTKIDKFPLATITLTDTYIMESYVQEILLLLERKALANPELRIMHPTGVHEIRSPSEVRERLQRLLSLNQLNGQKPLNSRNSQESDSDEGRYIFSAALDTDALNNEFLRPPVQEQDRNGIIRYRLPRVIDLATDEGWKDFQGSVDEQRLSQGAGRVSRNQASTGKPRSRVTHWTEIEAASLLIERARVYLKHNLLELTTIADTPGTDSVNAGHDHVTTDYLQRASAYILLLPTKLVDSERTNLSQKENNILTQLANILKGNLQRIAFVVNCWSTTEDQALTKEKIEKYAQILRAAFKLRAEEWNAMQRDPVRKNFFVVQLKGIQEGERPSLLHGYPSLVPLQIWIEKTFRSGKYRVRYDHLMQALTSDWQQKAQVWVQKLNDLYQDAARREQLCKNLRQFLRDLQVITENHLEDIATFQQNFTNQGKNVTRMMMLRGENPKGFRKSEELLPWRNALQIEYGPLNDLLQGFARHYPVETWIKEVKIKAHSLPIQLPALVAPDPAAQNNAWGNQRFLTSSVAEAFASVMEQWPDGFWQKVKGIFKDSRIPLVKDLQAFWQEQYEDIWSRRLERYLQRCTTFLKEQQQAIQTLVQAELAEQERMNDPELRKRREQEIKQVIKAFEDFEGGRKEIQQQLHYALVSS